MRVGVVGCGSIGRTLARALVRFAPVTKLALFDLDPAKADALARLHRRYRAVRSLAALVRASDLVVEAASPRAAAEVAPAALRAGRQVLLMSVGALADDRLRAQVLGIAARGRGRILVPSGAVGGLEVVASAAAARLFEVTLTTRKPPAALSGAPYLVRRGVDLRRLRAPRVVFSGTAREAVRHFPANINVAAALSLAALGFDRTRVILVADPRASTNEHEVVARGDFGTLRCTVSNVPFADNPKTSYLAALSAVATVKSAARGVHFGP
jgi:aspartate dehydrogenase